MPTPIAALLTTALWAGAWWPSSLAVQRAALAMPLARFANFGSHAKLGRMAPHFPAGTTYRVVLRRDRTYGVEVSKPKSTPFIVNGFRTEAEADGWIKFQRLRTKERDA